MASDPKSRQSRAELIDRLLKSKGISAPRTQGIPKRPEGADSPLSFAQQRLWFLDQLEPGGAAYNLAGAVRLTGSLDVAALEGALSAIIARHEILRTTFEAEEGRPKQVVHPAELIRLDVQDLRGLAQAAREEALHAEARREAGAPFDLGKGPLVRLRLIALQAKSEGALEEHVLLYTMHHIVSDAWSKGVLIGEVAQLYQAFVTGRAKDAESAAALLPALPIQYADYAHHQLGHLAGEVLAEQIAFWKSHLAGAPEALDLPTDRPRPPVQTQAGARQGLALSKALSDSLRSVAKREGATLFMVLLAAWDALLQRYSGQDDIVVGVPVANRGRTETEGLIGFFVNTLPVRVDLSENPTFTDLIARVKGATTGAFAHQDIPFERLVEEIAPERDASRTPLFQVALVLQNIPIPTADLAGLRMSEVEADTGTAKFDLTLTIIDGPERLLGELEYNTDLFDAQTMERLLVHFERLLTAATADPSARIGALPMLSEAEKQVVLTAWNATEAELPEGAVHALFSAQAARDPEALAVAQEGRTLSYGALDKRSNQLARHLVKLGVAPGGLVGLCLNRSIETLVGALAILKAGAAYVAMDPSLPAERIAFVVGDTAMRAVLTDRATLEKLVDAPAEAIALDAETQDFDGESDAALDVAVGPTDLAYVIYTSGSTGTPKGVEIPHQGLLNLSVWHQREYALGPADRATHLASPGFDASVWELWPYLIAGSSLHIVDDETRGDPAALGDFLVAQAITIGFLPTPLAEALLATGFPGAKKPALRAVLTGGDKLHKAPPADLPFRLINHYGPSEYSVVTTAIEVGHETTLGAAPPIGRPIANTRVYIVDAQMQPVPVGVPGELCVGGVGLARGYVGSADLTAEKFIENPFAAGDSAYGRLYKTGDLVRYLPDGAIEFLGRIDHQVKIRGFRIELGEIEAVLGAAPGVRDAVVLAYEGGPGGRTLAGYVVAAEGASPSASDLRDALKKKLPDYMVPSSFAVLDAFPLTPNGKIDRRALPAPDLSAIDAIDYVAPRDAIEEVLAGIWADVLKQPRIGVHDGFFERGGHSLLATQIVARAASSLGVKVPLRSVFDAPTVAGLAAAIRKAREEDSGVSAPPLEMAPRDETLMLSFGQERLWFLSQLEGDNPFYNIPLGLRLEGPLDAGVLARSLHEVVRRHEVLRTTYKAMGGRPVPIVHASMDLPLHFIDRSDLTGDAQKKAVQEDALADLSRPFDLSQGPMLRTVLIKLGQDDHALLLTMHHIAVDAWTTGVMTREVAAIYKAFAKGDPSPLSELPIQYVDYATWQRKWLSGATLDAELAYWKSALDGAPTTLDLPTDRPRPPVQTFHGSHATASMPERVVRALEAMCRREGVTTYMAALAAFNVLLYRYTGQDDILVGTSRADRRHPETEGLIGYFLNQLVLRTRLSGSPSFRELLGRVRDATLSAYEHQDLPFERLVEALSPERDLSRSPVFQVMVDNPLVPSFPTIEGMKVSGLAAEVATSRFDLTLAVVDKDGLIASLEYNADLFDRATVMRMLGHLEAILEQGAADPTRSIDTIALLSDTEQKTLAAWNATSLDYATDGCIHHLIEAQAARTPDAIAVSFEGESVTYRELESRANKVARFLQSMGAGPEVTVGVCVERSVAMVVGVLGVLKAGAAYVPFDPAWPAERLSFMLEDTGAPFLLTQESVADLLPVGHVQVTCLDADWDAMIEGQSDAPVTSEATGESLAYVIYTSGSTGKPKGVLVAHKHLVHSTRARLAYYEEPVTSFLLLSSFAFDSSMAGIYWTLIQGGTITLPREGLVEDPAELAAMIEKTRVSHLLCVPSLYTFLLAVAKDEQLASLRAVMVAGEAAPVETVKQHHDRFPETRLYNEYGPTEATVWCSVYETKKGESGPRVSIGKPIANTQIHLLDAHKQVVPVGVPGELYVGGWGVTRGYLNRSELTAEKFVASPFAEGETLYRTGDLAKWRTDGNIDFLGRIDHQVKIRGYRIELGEIESVLAQHRGVLEVIVIVREDAPGDLRLVAYLVPSDVTAPSAADLRAHLGEALPEYMIPSAFVVLEAMPLLPNGKIDRKKLPAPEARSGVEGALVAPRNPVEDVIAGIWSDVLGADKVGVHDSFFELGGHSLLATQVIARVIEAFHVDVPLHVLFDEPTVAALAAEVEEAVRKGQGLTALPIEKAPRDAALPLSFGQERLWVLDQIEPGSSFYNLPGAVRLRGALDSEALSAAIAIVVERHEALRTTFGVSGGRPSQNIAESADLTPIFVDLSHVAEADQEAAIALDLRTDGAKPFDLARGPLARMRLLKLDDEHHVLVLTMHHIVADGWSLGVLIREIGALYPALARGETPKLPALPIQYVDYAAWQRGWMKGDVLDRELSYWREALRGAPTALDLVTDRPRPPVQSYAGSRKSFTLSPELSKALGQLCRHEGVTLYMLALAAFNTLLFRWSGQDDILVGTSVADRKKTETSGLIGYFLNQLVFRTKMDGDPTFRALLGRVREACLGAYAHQDLPFERLVEEMRLRPDMSRTPLFQVMVDVPNAPSAPLDLEGIVIEGLHAEVGTARFDLTLSMSEQQDGLAGSLEYATDLFDATTIDRMLAHLEALLEDAAKSPDKKLWELSILPDEERELLVTTWNETAREYPKNACIHERFEAQVDKAPDAIAVTSEGEKVTFGQLDERANRLAHHLIAFGVGPDVLVGLSLPRSIDLVVGMLAVLKAGGAYVPIDPSYPDERLSFMLDDSMVPVVVTNEAIEGGLPAQSALVVRVDGDADEIAAQPSERPSAGATPENLAYMIYTSGSTGKPKGALIHHRGVVNYLTWAIDAYDVASGDGAPVHSSVSFDLTVTALFAPLLAGKAAHLVPEGDDVFALGEALKAHPGMSLVKITPAHLEVLAHALSPSDIRGATGAFVIGGEALAWEAIALFRENAPKTKLINEYGPTETVVGCCVYDAAIGDAGRGSVPIGRPIANTQLYVLDAHMQPTPIGVPGELFIGGDGVGRGYWNLPELTEARFLPDPFRSEEGAKLYKTGDLARYLPSGDLDFLGRLDHQVKVRGYRIELGEIEAELRAHSALAEVVVIAREDAPGDKRLVAYVVPSDATAPPEAADLKAHLAAALPDYMIPSAFVVLDALPLTSNGKVDRKALPAPDARSASRAEHVAPAGAIEEGLAAIWAEVLGAEGVSVHDDFFELGGHSLIATQVLARVRSAFGVDLPFRVIFESPTIAGLSERIGEARGEGKASSAAITRAPRDAELPLSFAQERLWFLDQLDPQNPSYNVPEAVRIKGPLDVPAFQKALASFVDRHEALRTTFPAVDGRAVARIHEAIRLDVPVLDLTGLPPASREEKARAEIAREASLPFDLARGPLVRARLLRTAEDEHVLLFTTHHIVTDAWSVGLLLREVGALYEAALAGKTAALAELPIQYVDFAAWQRRLLEGALMDEQLAYWTTALEGLRGLDLPTDRPRPPEQTFAGAKLTFRLPKSVSSSIEALGREEGATPFMLLLAAFSIVLGRYAGQDDVAVGTPVANRGRAEIEGVFGLFLNTLVLRTDLSGEPTFREVVRRVKERLLAAQTYQDIPFEKLVDALAPTRDMSRTPLFSVFFVVQNAGDVEARMPGLALERMHGGEVTAKFDLAIALGEGESGLVGAFEYNTDLFDRETIERLSAAFSAALAAGLKAPDEKAHALPIVSAADREKLLVTWNATREDYPKDTLVHALVTARAAETPDKVALVFEDEELTYAALEAQGNQLARRLVALGVGPSVLVGLCVSRSAKMVIAMLAIAKAGGAYVPLDPDYPEARLAFILEDAKAPVLVTEASLTGLLPGHVGARLCLDTDWPEVLRESADPLPPRAGPTDLAYAIYTSGSTGKPKGVGIPHRALTNFVETMRKTPGVRATDRLLAVTSLSFDIAGLEIYVPLVAGGCVDIAHRDVVFDGQRLADRLTETGATIMQATPATWRVLLDAGFAGKPDLVMLCGGEALPRSLADALLDKGAALWNMFGPTETTIWSAVHRVGPAAGLVPIGRPIANTQLYVLDAHLQPAPIGAAGELLIGGDGLARGYSGLPELTADRFIASPFAAGERLYRTGDLARFLPSGEVEFLGRLDHQVKIRGFRIELGEIEAALVKHALVREAVVLAREDAPGQKRLVAYVVTEDGQALSSADARAFLRESLPDYMIPPVTVRLDRFPLTPNGKVDRRAMPAPSASAEGAAGDFVAPKNEAEAILAKVFADVLGAASVSTDANFFELGGDSILSIQVVSRARKEGLRITPRHVFQHQTVAELASVAEVAKIVAAEQGPVTGKVPLTPMERRFFERAWTAPHHANQAVLLESTGPIDEAAMAKAALAVFAHHDALRLRVAKRERGYEQVIAPIGRTAPLRAVSLVDATAEERDRAIFGEASLAQTSLDLAEGPLARIVLFDLGPSRPARLLVVAHRLVVDGPSWPILLEDLWSAYEAERAGRPVALPPKTTSWKRWAERLIESLAAPETAAELSRLRTEAAREPVLLPRDGDGSARDEASAKTHVVTLSEAETAPLLGDAPAAYRAEPSDLLLTALGMALQGITNSRAHLVALDGSGRDEPSDEVDVTRTVGALGTTYPVWLDVAVDEGLGGAIKSVKEQVRRVPRGGLDFDLLRTCGDDDARAALAPMASPEVAFHDLGQRERSAAEGSPLRPVEGSLGPAVDPGAQREHLLDVAASFQDGALHVVFTFSEGAHKRATVEGLAARFLDHLRALIAHCLSPEAGGYTPSDFKKANVSQETLDMLAALDEDEDDEDDA